MLIFWSLVCTLGFGYRIDAQVRSRLLPDRLSITDQSNPFIGAEYRLNGLNIQDGFNSSTITPSSISAGVRGMEMCSILSHRIREPLHGQEPSSSVGRPLQSPRMESPVTIPFLLYNSPLIHPVEAV